LEINVITSLNILNDLITQYISKNDPDTLAKINDQVNKVNTAYTAFNTAINKSDTKKYNTINDNGSIPKQSITDHWKNIQNMRNDIDMKLMDLSKTDKSKYMMNKQQYDASIYEKILWTALATSVIYYAFLHI
jgi:hypothetical protein